VSARKGIVLDANILIRAVFGRRVQEILERFEHAADFYSPDVCFDDVSRYIPILCAKRKLDPSLPFLVLDHVSKLILSVERSLYAEREEDARARIRHDPDDWPVIALALVLGIPIWTEDADFFGAGVATWTTATVDVYLRSTA
jgi:predicted nucleic acid-binding protein